MATRTVVCPECDEPVPYGRLSCPNCGSLLASVAGAPRRQASLPIVEVAEPPNLVPDNGTNGHVAVATPVAGAPVPRVRKAPTRTPKAAVAAPEPAAASAPAEPEPREPVVEPEPSADEVAPTAAPGDLDDAAEPAPPEVELPSDPPVPPASRAVPAEPRWPEQGAAPTWSRPAPPVLHDWPPASPAPAAEPAAQPAWPPQPSAPFGLQPATVTSEVVAASHARPALPPTPAGAWLPPSASFGPAQPNGATRGNAQVEGASPTDAVQPGQASFLADLPFDTPEDLAGWLVTIGSGVALIGFFLPWTAAMPFTTDFGYTSRWGLAVPSHLLLVLATLLLFVSSIIPSRIPLWLRSGLAPVVFGGLLLGIVWPFVIGGFRSDIGSLAVAVGAMILIVGGGLVVRADRHAARRSGV
jgi:hypothetical protein